MDYCRYKGSVGLPWAIPEHEHKEYNNEGDCATVKYKYCQNCKKAYVRSRLEKDNCIYCNQPCETVDVKRNNWYYFGYAIMVIGAISALTPRIIEVSGQTFFIIIGLVLAFAGAAFVMMGSVNMANAAAELVQNKNDDDQ